MNRRRYVAAAFAVAVGLTGIVALSGAFGIASPFADGRSTPTNTSTATPAAEVGLSDGEVANRTRLVALGEDGSVTAAESQLVGGETPLAAGTNVTVRVRSESADQPFVESTTATVADDGTFRGRVNLSQVTPGRDVRVAVLYDNRKLANATAMVVPSEDEAVLDYNGDAVTLRNESNQTVSGLTGLDPGSEVRVRLRGSGDQPFIEQRAATVERDGTFETSFTLTHVEPGATFHVVVVHDGDRLATEPGEVVERE